MSKLLIANWKMYLTHEEVEPWLLKYSARLDEILEKTKNTLVLCPSFTELVIARNYITEKIALGAQNCGHEERGAHTGEVSIISLAQIGCTHVILGHSERRTLGETDEQIALKVAIALKHRITPIVCVGETREERDNGRTLAIIENQLSVLIPHLRYMGGLSIAYEPIWAIGTGITPSADQVRSICNWIKKYTLHHDIRCNILYGGSITPGTIAHMPIQDLDGFLVGEASTDGEGLLRLIYTLG